MWRKRLWRKYPPDNPKGATVYLISGKKIIEASEPGKYDEYYAFYEIEDIELVYPGIRELVKRGDIFEDISDDNYRGNAQFFFDGEKTIHPGTEIDAYGEPPKEFEIITEFLPGCPEADAYAICCLLLRIRILRTEMRNFGG